MITKLQRKLLTDVSALDTAALIGPGALASVTELAFYLVFSLGCTAGQLTIESAHDPAFTGKWAPLHVIDFLEANRAHHVAITAEHIAVRVRVSTGIAGGTVSAIVIGS